MAEADGIQEGDPDRAATAIRDMLETADAPLRLPLGAEAVRNLTRVYQRDLDDVQKWAAVSESADFPGHAASRARLLSDLRSRSWLLTRWSSASSPPSDDVLRP